MASTVNKFRFESAEGALIAIREDEMTAWQGQYRKVEATYLNRRNFRKAGKALFSRQSTTDDLREPMDGEFLKIAKFQRELNRGELRIENPNLDPDYIPETAGKLSVAANRLADFSARSWINNLGPTPGSEADKAMGRMAARMFLLLQKQNMAEQKANLRLEATYPRRSNILDFRNLAQFAHAKGFHAAYTAVVANSFDKRDKFSFDERQRREIVGAMMDLAWGKTSIAQSVSSVHAARPSIYYPMDEHMGRLMDMQLALVDPSVGENHRPQIRTNIKALAYGAWDRQQDKIHPHPVTKGKKLGHVSFGDEYNVKVRYLLMQGVVAPALVRFSKDSAKSASYIGLATLLEDENVSHKKLMGILREGSKRFSFGRNPLRSEARVVGMSPDFCREVCKVMGEMREGRITALDAQQRMFNVTECSFAEKDKKKDLRRSHKALLKAQRSQFSPPPRYTRTPRSLLKTSLPEARAKHSQPKFPVPAVEANAAVTEAAVPELAVEPVTPEVQRPRFNFSRHPNWARGAALAGATAVLFGTGYLAVSSMRGNFNSANKTPAVPTATKKMVGLYEITPAAQPFFEEAKGRESEISLPPERRFAFKSIRPGAAEKMVDNVLETLRGPKLQEIASMTLFSVEDLEHLTAALEKDKTRLVNELVTHRLAVIPSGKGEEMRFGMEIEPMGFALVENKHGKVGEVYFIRHPFETVAELPPEYNNAEWLPPGPKTYTPTKSHPAASVAETPAKAGQKTGAAQKASRSGPEEDQTMARANKIELEGPRVWTRFRPTSRDSALKAVELLSDSLREGHLQEKVTEFARLSNEVAKASGVVGAPINQNMLFYVSEYISNNSDPAVNELMTRGGNAKFEIPPEADTNSPYSAVLTPLGLQFYLRTPDGTQKPAGFGWHSPRILQQFEPDIPRQPVTAVAKRTAPTAN